MVVSFKIPKGAEVFIGAPAQPMPAERSLAIAESVRLVSRVVEAHLPQCFVPGTMGAAAQVLVVVGAPGTDKEALASLVAEHLTGVLRGQRFIDVWPMIDGEEMLETVRRAGCRIVPANGQIDAPGSERPWWRFWS